MLKCFLVNSTKLRFFIKIYIYVCVCVCKLTIKRKYTNYFFKVLKTTQNTS